MHQQAMAKSRNKDRDRDHGKDPNGENSQNKRQLELAKDGWLRVLNGGEAETDDEGAGTAACCR